MGGGGAGDLFIGSFIVCLFLISRHMRLVISVLNADDRNPLTNTDAMTMQERTHNNNNEKDISYEVVFVCYGAWDKQIKLKILVLYFCP